MFEYIQDVIEYHETNDVDKYKKIYKEFKNNTIKYYFLKHYFKLVPGFGELPFHWNWFLIVQHMPLEFSFLEIGVYKGRILSLIQILADYFKKHVSIFGITPLSIIGDKYSTYADSNYKKEIVNTFKTCNVTYDNTTIIKGMSQDYNVIQQAKASSLYDILFIDGSHDYDEVCQDFENYIPLLQSNGILVLDDAALFLENAHGSFLGHLDVARAIRDHLDNDVTLTFLYAVGHNRVYMKM